MVLVPSRIDEDAGNDQKKEMPESDMVPVLYCASGKAVCTDLGILTKYASVLIVTSGRKMTYRTENQWATSASRGRSKVKN
jgi:hypothetical protein